jgi:CRISPR-associated protein Csm4
VFQVLGDDGLGGERAYGYGHFTPGFAAVPDVPGATGGEYFTTLSPYLPQPAESAVFDDHVRYAITLRRGWLSTPGYANLRRPTVRMVDTGAVLKWPGGAVVGCLADATPTVARASLAVRRYGIAWPVPVAAAALEN